MLGVFSTYDWDKVHDRLNCSIQEMSITTLSECMNYFIHFCFLAHLRTHTTPKPEIVRWLIQVVNERNLDAKLIDTHDFDHIRATSNANLTMKEYASFLEKRVLATQSSSDQKAFSNIPDQYPLHKWVTFDPSNPEDVASFNLLSRLVLHDGYIPKFVVPYILSHFDPEGIVLSQFVRSTLEEFTSSHKEICNLSYVACGYSSDSSGWRTVSTPIIHRVQSFSRKERERIYWTLSSHETGVITSHPSKVAQYYFNVRDKAKAQLDLTPSDSPLKEYWEWALKVAIDDIDRERMSIGDDSDE